jgi:hypothetical protein
LSFVSSFVSSFASFFLLSAVVVTVDHDLSSLSLELFFLFDRLIVYCSPKNHVSDFSPFGAEIIDAGRGYFAAVIDLSRLSELQLVLLGFASQHNVRSLGLRDINYHLGWWYAKSLRFSNSDRVSFAGRLSRGYYQLTYFREHGTFPQGGKAVFKPSIQLKDKQPKKKPRGVLPLPRGVAIKL